MAKARTVVELTADEQRLLDAFRKIEAADAQTREHLKQTGQTIDQHGRAVIDAMTKAGQAVNNTSDKAVNNLVKMLAGGSDEGKELAKVLREDMAQGALKAEGGIEGISKKIIGLRPELAGSVDKWKRDMAEAAKYGEGKYEDALNALRAGDPISSQVAKAIRTNLVSAGEIVERSFEEMVQPLERIDPAMAAQARKMRGTLQMVERDSKGVFSRISKFATSEIAQIALAYVGIQEAVQAITDKMREQQEVLTEGATTQRELASAQHSALKNLAMLPEGQRMELLEREVPRVARAKAFPDLINLTKAYGDTASAGANFEQLKNIVPVAAALTPMETDTVDEMSAAIFDAVRATGNNDAEQVVSQMLVAGTQARIVDPMKLARNISPVMVAAATDAPEQMREKAALQGAALFTAMTRGGTDPVGDASQTMGIQVTNRLGEFFRNLGKDATEAQKELASLEREDPLTAVQRQEFNRLNQAEASKAKTDQRIAAINQELSGIEAKERAGGLMPEEKRQLAWRKKDLKKELRQAESMEFTDRDAARLQDLRESQGEADRKWKAERAKLQGRIAAAQIDGYEGETPVLLSEQIRVMRENPELLEAFESEKFGEQRFRPTTRNLFRGGQSFTDFQNAMAELERRRGDSSMFREKAREAVSGTSAIRESHYQRMAEASDLIQHSFDPHGAQVGQFREDLAEMLQDTRSGGIRGWGQWMREFGIRYGRLPGSGIEEVFTGLDVAAGQKAALMAGGVQPSERPRLRRVEGFMDSAFGRLQNPAALEGADMETLQTLAGRATYYADQVREGSSAGAFAENSEMFLRLERVMTQILQEQKKARKATEQTANNTKPGGGSPRRPMQDAARNSDERAGR